MNMIFIKNFEEFGHVFVKLLIFLFSLIKYCAYPWFWLLILAYWPSWPSSLLTIESIDNWAYQPSSLSTIEHIDPSHLLTSGLPSRLLSLSACCWRTNLSISMFVRIFNFSWKRFEKFEEVSCYHWSCIGEHCTRFLISWEAVVKVKV